MITNPLLKNAQSQVTDPIGYTGNFLSTITSIFFVVAVVYFLWHFVFAGYHFISAEGDQKKIEDAKKEITYAMVGLFAVFSVFAVLKIIGLVFGISGLETLRLTIPTL